MLPTVEIRWFLKEDLDSWPQPFAEPGPDSKKRTDWYALSHRASGIKFRGGGSANKLEVKLLMQELGLKSIAGVTGKMEEWKKWAYHLNGPFAPVEGHLAPAGWIAVEKTRSLLVYAVEGESLRKIDPDREPWPTNGAQIELTKLGVGKDRWLTAGLEAFGFVTGSQMEKSLCVVGQEVLPRLKNGLRLDEENSYSYPEWLGRIFTNEP